MISFVIPVYNSALILPDLYRRIVTVFSGDSFELIFVEDGSSDNSWNVIELLSSADNRVQGSRMSRNYGQHNALLCGIRQASGDIIVTLDDDLQHPPEEIPKLLNLLKKECDVVYGVPNKSVTHGVLRHIASTFYRWLLKSSVGNANELSAFRAFRTFLRDSFHEYRSPVVNIDVLLTWGTNRHASVFVDHDVRRLGRSGYTFRKLFRHALNMVTGYSTWPLRIASLLGFLCALFGVGVLIYVLTNWLYAGSVIPGFSFLAAIISIFSGAQLMSLGIIGEYLSRMYLRSIDQPSYMVRDRVGNSKYSLSNK